MADDDTELNGDDPGSDVGAAITGSRDYDHSYEGWAAFCDADPEWAERYNEFAEYVLRRDCDPAAGLSHKMRELLIVAFAADGGHVDICADHMAKASDYGATTAEIHQIIQMEAV